AEAGVMLATHGAAKWPLPPLALLREQGVTVFAGNDDVRDTWSPYGTGDVLARAALIGWRADYRRDDQLGHVFELITTGAARAFGVDAYGIDVGARADFFTVQAENLQEAVASHPARGWVVKGGCAVARDGKAL
ncbi:MAG TPA: amidohydrolase family protein, partial [Bordetella sp.]|nr:amidohydrolase family protein [Bordetella sp.]